MADTQQAKVFLTVSAPGDTSFTLHSFRGVERLSSLFEYNLMMLATSREVDFSTMMGQSATVSVSVGDKIRTYNGIIGQFEQDDTPFKPLQSLATTYRATLYPKLWLLTFSGQCRIFQNKSTLDIIKSVLDGNQIPYSNQVTSSGMDSLEFCVQYNETDFDFICRLMEREGIFYFFQQTQNNHTLVLADSPAAHVVCPNAASASFHDSAVQDQFALQISSCFITQRIVPQSNTIKSYNYLTPQTPLKAVAAGAANAGGGSLTNYHQIYDKQSRGDTLAKIQLQAEELPQKMVEGLSTIPFFLAGYKFHLDNHPRDDVNLDYVLYEVSHEAHLESEEGEAQTHLYKNSYRAFPATIPFRPFQLTPKPRIYSTQTARVTGKQGEEIYTEEYGRIKVKFHWDPSDKEDDSTSCWIRVATLWAGQTWGTLFTPRIGQEVVISFIDGDPDKPLVVGSVYNGDNKPPYLPDEPTKSTIKTRTSKKEGDSTPGYNELRFEDKKGSEEVYLRAQKDFKAYIQNNQDVTIVGGSRTVTLQAQKEDQEERASEQSNDSLIMKNGKKSVEIDKGDYAVLMKEGDKSLKITKGNYVVELTEGNIKVTCSKGDVSFNVIGNISFTCTGDFTVNPTGNFNVTAGQGINVTAGASAAFTSGSTFAMTSGGHFSSTSGGNLSATAGGTANIQSGGDVSLSSGATMTITTGMALNIAAGLSFSTESGANTAIVSGLGLELAAAGTATMTAPAVELAGFVTSNGTPVI